MTRKRLSLQTVSYHVFVLHCSKLIFWTVEDQPGFLSPSISWPGLLQRCQLIWDRTSLISGINVERRGKLLLQTFLNQLNVCCIQTEFLGFGVLDKFEGSPSLIGWVALSSLVKKRERERGTLLDCISGPVISSKCQPSVQSRPSRGESISAPASLGNESKSWNYSC